MRMSLRILVLLFMSTVVKGIEPTNCSSLVQRDAATRSRTSDVLEIAKKEGTWAAVLQRHRQMLSTYLSDVERMLAGQKPQSNSSWIMMTISVVITAVMLVGGCIVLSRVHKAWNASVSGTQARSQVPGFPSSTSSLGSTRAVQRAPKPSPDDTSTSLGAARAREELPVLCDDLVVPENRECVLLVPKLDRDEVAINDHQGQQVFVAQQSEEEDSRIVLLSPTHEIFATVRTARASGGMAALAIHDPYEKEFGILKGMKGGDYELTGSGRRIRFQTSSGRLNIVDEDTRIMALSESERGQRQFRIGPRVDVGLVISCILGIDLLESDFR